MGALLAAQIAGATGTCVAAELDGRGAFVDNQRGDFAGLRLRRGAIPAEIIFWTCVPRRPQVGYRQLTAVRVVFASATIGLLRDQPESTCEQRELRLFEA